MKQFLLKSIVDEPSLQVKKHIIQLIAVLAKHELLRSNWNELFALVETYIKSNNSSEREVFSLNIIMNSNY